MINKLLVCGIIASLALTSCGPSKKKLKDDFVKACNESGDKQVQDPTMRTMFHEYCDCAGDKAVEKFTTADWKEINKWQKTGEEQKLLQKITPVIQPCLTDLQNKMMKAIGAENNAAAPAQSAEPLPNK